MKKMFISYCHEDVNAVKSFMQLLPLNTFDLWMDEKNITVGSNYTTKIFNAIHDSDFYVVFISAHSVNSSWVEAEIDFALQQKIDGNKLIIIPVRLDETEIPVPLSNIHHIINAQPSIGKAARELADKCSENTKAVYSTSNFEIASVAFEIAEKTDVEIGPFIAGLTEDDLEICKQHLLTSIRKKAAGILMNFVSVSDFDFLSPVPRFKNGMYEEDSRKVSGSTAGSICEKVRIEATVFNPDEEKVYRLLKDRLKILKVNAISFGISVHLEDGEEFIDVGRRCLQKIQDNYTILSYDNIEGARVELGDDFYLALLVTEDILKIKLTTKYDFQFVEKIKAFSISDFVTDLLA